MSVELSLVRALVLKKLVKDATEGRVVLFLLLEGGYADGNN